MSKKTQQSKQDQTYSTKYDWMTSPTTPEMQKVLTMANEPTQVDPSITGRYGAIENEIKNSYNDPFGSYTTQDVKEKSLRSNLMKLGTEKDKALREGYADAKSTDWLKANTAAAYTAPQLVSTGGTSSGTSSTQQSGGFWMSVLPGIIGGAAA